MPAPMSRTTPPTRRCAARRCGSRASRPCAAAPRKRGAFVVFTRIDGKPGGDGIGCVLVEKDTPGLVLSGKFHTMGGEYLHEVRFEDCELPAENLLLGEGGLKKLLSAFNTQRCLNPSISLGLAEGAFDEALRYARERTRSAGRSANSRACAGSSPTCTTTSKPAAACSTAPALPPIRSPIRCSRRRPRCFATRCRSVSRARRSRSSAATASPTSSWCRASIAARVTAASAAGTSETLRDLIGKRLMGTADLTDGIFGFSNF